MSSPNNLVNINFDCLYMIFEYLSYRDIVRFERVCMLWYNVAKSYWLRLKNLDIYELRMVEMGCTRSQVDKYILPRCVGLQSLGIGCYHYDRRNTFVMNHRHIVKKVTYFDLSAFTLYLIAWKCTNLEHLIMNTSPLANPRFIVDFKKILSCMNLKTLHFYQTFVYKCYFDEINTDSLENLIFEKCYSEESWKEIKDAVHQVKFRAKNIKKIEFIKCY